jgi:hypothetical protein
MFTCAALSPGRPRRGHERRGRQHRFWDVVTRTALDVRTERFVVGFDGEPRDLRSCRSVVEVCEARQRLDELVETACQ